MKQDVRPLPLFRMICLVAVFVFGVMAIVGSSSKGGGDTASIATPTISGTVATGAPVVGYVYIKDAKGKTDSSAIDENGNYKNFEEFTPPIILWAKGTNADGKEVELFATGVEVANNSIYNITPATDLAVRIVTNNAVNATPEMVFNNAPNLLNYDYTDINTAKETVLNLLKPVYKAFGCWDPDSDEKPLQIGSACDLALDYLDFRYEEDENVIVITNELNGDDVTVSPNGTADKEFEIDGATPEEAEAIRDWIERLETLYATEPEDDSVTSFFNGWVAEDFFENGQTREETLNRWITTDESPSVGWKILTFSVDEEMSADEYDPNKYEKAYRITLWSKNGTIRERHDTATVFDGSRWLWYGNQTWIECEIHCTANMTISPEGNVSVFSGLELHFDDEYNYAYEQQGVRSAIVTGPGLSDKVVVLKHFYPENYLSIFDTANIRPHNLPQKKIDEIEGDSVYEIRLYGIEAADVSLNNTPLATYAYQLSGRPPLSLDKLVPNNFPTFVSPTSHNLDATNIPGQLRVKWKNPESDLWDTSWINLSGYFSGGTYSEGKDFRPGGATSATIKTTDWAYLGLYHADLTLWGRDNFSRRFSYTWQFNEYND